MVEAHGLTTEVKTLDLETFLEYMQKQLGLKLQPVIRWVDDCHALFVCSSGTEGEKRLRTGGALERGHRFRSAVGYTWSFEWLPCTVSPWHVCQPLQDLGLGSRRMKWGPGMLSQMNTHFSVQECEVPAEPALLLCAVVQS